MQRKCKSCGEEKNAEAEFYSFIAKGKWKCFSSYCKKCHVEKSQKRERANPEKARERGRKKSRKKLGMQCKICSKKNDGSVPFHIKTMRGESYVSNYCESCWSEKELIKKQNRKAKKKRYALKHAKEIKEKRDRTKPERKESFKKWLKANPEKSKERLDRRKMKMAGVWTEESKLVTQSWFASICREADMKCYYCGEVSKLTMDHVIPIIKGGKHIRSNIVPSCQSCNSSKGSRLISDWNPSLTIPIYGLDLASA